MQNSSADYCRLGSFEPRIITLPITPSVLILYHNNAILDIFCQNEDPLYAFYSGYVSSTGNNTFVKKDSNNPVYLLSGNTFRIYANREETIDWLSGYSLSAYGLYKRVYFSGGAAKTDPQNTLNYNTNGEKYYYIAW